MKCYIFIAEPALTGIATSRSIVVRSVWINLIVVVLMFSSMLTPTMFPQMNILTRGYTSGRTGANLNETVLKPDNVNPEQFGKLFNIPVDGQIYAQPLYVSNLTISGASHNVVYTATMSNSIYAMDADSGAILWSKNYGTPISSQEVQNFPNISFQAGVGILGTPAIDLDSKTLFFVSGSEEVIDGKPVYNFHLNAVDLTTGAPVHGSPTNIAATYTTPDLITPLIFDAKLHNQRTGLAIASGNVYIAFASHDDIEPYHGWLLAYSTSTLQQTGVYSDTTVGHEGGIWNAGAAPTIDASGNVYVSTGNGAFGKTPNGLVQTGNSFIKLSPSLQLLDYFTPSNSSSLNAGDMDLGSSGLLLIPNSPYLLGGGKQGVLYLADTNSLGQFDASSDQVRQEFQAVFGKGTSHIHGAPVYFMSDTLGPATYVWGENDVLRGYLYDASRGLINTQPYAVGAMTAPVTNNYGAMPGGFLSISANGAHDGVVWASTPYDADSQGASVRGVLYAFDATTLNLLWSDKMQDARDEIGRFAKYCPPVVANGKMFVPNFGANGATDGTGSLMAYGLLPRLTINVDSKMVVGGSPIPTLTGSVSGLKPGDIVGQSVVITYSTTATINSPAGQYPITAAVTGSYYGVVNAGTLTITPPAATQLAIRINAASMLARSPIPLLTGSVMGLRSEDVLGGSIQIAYNTTATSSSPPGIYPITASVTGAAVSKYWVVIAPATLTVVPNALNSLDLSQGFTPGAMVLNGTSTLVGGRLRLSDGELNGRSSAFTSYPMSVQGFTSDFTFQLTNPQADGFMFVLQNQSPTAIGGIGLDLGYGSVSGAVSGGIGQSVGLKFDLYSNAGEGPNSTGLYINGERPTGGSIDLRSTGIDLHSGNPFRVHLAYNGTVLTVLITDAVTNAVASETYTVDIPAIVGRATAYAGFSAGTGGLSATQDLLGWVYTPSVKVLNPTFSPPFGVYVKPQTVILSSATTGADVHYTVDGSLPTAASPLYSGPVQVGASTTIKAIADFGSAMSDVVSGAYVIVQSTTTLLNVSSPSAPVGTALSISATVLPQTATGSVTFYDGALKLDVAPLQSGTASLAVRTLALGEHHLSAVYTATQEYSASSSPTVDVVVTPSPVSTQQDLLSADKMALNGSAVFADSIVRLTDGGLYEAASAFTKSAFSLSSFATEFTFQLRNPDADGIMFVLQSQASNSLGGYGNDLGFGNGGAAMVRSVGVKFDLYNNFGEGMNSTGLYLNGARPIVPAIDLGPSGIDLHSGHLFHVSMVYSNLLLTVSLTDTTSGQTSTNVYPVDIPAALGQNSGFAGFTGGTGSKGAIQEILSWSMNGGATHTTTVLTVLGHAIEVGSPAPVSISVSPMSATGQIALLDGQTLIGSGTLSGGSTSISIAGLAIGDHQLTAIYQPANSLYTASTSTVTTLTISPVSTQQDLLSADKIALNGSAVFADSIVRLTDGGLYEAASAFTKSAFSLSSFATEFTFQLRNPDADGIMFVLQSQASNSLGGYGNDLGFGNGGAAMVRSVGVKFDLYNNFGEGMNSTGLYLNGARPIVPAIDLGPSGIDLHSGHLFHVSMVYSNLLLTVSLTDTTSGQTSTNVYPVDIPAALGQNSGFAGFTGGTGSKGAIQEILSWSMNGGATHTTTVLTVLGHAIEVGSPAPVSISVSPMSATGQIALLDGQTLIGSGTLSGGSTSISIAGLAIGDHQLTAIYQPANSLYTASTSTVTTLTISPHRVSTLGLGDFFKDGERMLNQAATLSNARSRLTSTGSYKRVGPFPNKRADIRIFANDFAVQVTNPTADGIMSVLHTVGDNSVGGIGIDLGFGIGTNAAPQPPGVTFDL